MAQRESSISCHSISIRSPVIHSIEAGSSNPNRTSTGSEKAAEMTLNTPIVPHHSFVFIVRLLCWREQRARHLAPYDEYVVLSLF